MVRADLLAVHLAATLLPAQAAAAAGITSPCQPNTSLLLLLYRTMLNMLDAFWGDIGTRLFLFGPSSVSMYPVLNS